MSRILLSGYYGFGNAGDEAVLAAILGSVRKQDPAVECAVLSAAPEATARLHGVTAFHRAHPREVMGALRRCDLFASGGGSLLQDVTSLNSLLFYLLQIRLARTLRRRVMVYAQGIGPLVRPAARRLTARVLRGVDGITVRDEESAVLLIKIGLKPGQPPVEVTADPVFALAPADAGWAASELLGQASGRAADLTRGREGGFLGVSVREWPGLEPHLERLAEVIREVTMEIGLVPVYFPLQRSQDAATCRRLAERAGGLVLTGDYAPAEWAALARQMRMFLGMRLHSLIFAAAGGVPVVGMAYDPKVTALLARLGQAPATALPAFNAGDVGRALRDTWNGRERRSVQIGEAARRLAAAAEVNARRAVELLPGNRRKPEISLPRFSEPSDSRDEPERRVAAHRGEP